MSAKIDCTNISDKKKLKFNKNVTLGNIIASQIAPLRGPFIHGNRVQKHTL